MLHKCLPGSLAQTEEILDDVAASVDTQCVDQKCESAEGR